MAEKLTPQQKQAVEDRGGKLLVSAAAGSGKTKVLVDRLMGYLLDPIAPANIDDFLIITYTKAAASELRGKIAAKLSERMAQEPENRHLQRQFQRLYLTQISTVHSFCSVILKEYAYKLDMPGDFRVADESECVELRQNVAQKVLEQFYDTAAENPDFCAFVDSQGLGRDDRLIPELVLKVYDSSRCHLDPEKWLQHCLRCTEAENTTDAAQTPYGRFLMDRLFDWLDAQLPVMEHCAAQAASTDGLEKPAVLLADTCYQLRYLRESKKWDEIIIRKNVDFGTLRFPKNCVDSDLVNHIKAVRDACKKGLARQTRHFSDPSELVVQELASSVAAVRGLIDMTRAFGSEYARQKRSRRILDFGDLEHNTLDLLLGTGRTGITQAAREIGSRYREIMVDEYQDSNGVQDAIYSALTDKDQNLFMVGDVKQSIYQFRLADPGIFLEKYAHYVSADVAVNGEGRKVLLSRNFRSGGAVLAAVNDVFRTCMSQRVGGLEYGASEALFEGIPHVPLGIPEVELCCVDVLESSYTEEAAYVANRIADMLARGEPVRDGDVLRPVQPEDIVILLRSPGSLGSYFQQALSQVGIRCATGGGEDLLQTKEIASLRSLLQVIHNPLLDIPLIAAVSSPIFGFTADDLALIRASHKNTTFYDALRQCDHPKAIAFVKTLDTLRQAARTQSLTEILEQIILLTHIDSIFSCMENGENRRANLQLFYQLASDFEGAGRRDLGRFLEYLDTMEERGLISAGEQSKPGCVTLMSIHKSKGLEFPVVFLCGLAREFNTESQRAAILCHKELGIGMAAVDHEKRLRYPTIAKSAISAKIGADGLSEEMRVLYVAMTRAKDRLIMTYASDRLEKDLQEIVLRMDMGGASQLIAEAVCPGEWILLTALRRTEAGELFALGGKPVQTTPGEPAWGIHVVSAPQLHVLNADEGKERTTLSPKTIAQLHKTLTFQYPYSVAISAPSKQTATQLKGRDKDAEAAENTRYARVSVRKWRKPSYRETSVQGKEYGTAIHTAMQHIDYAVCTDTTSVEEEISRLVATGRMTAEQGRMVRCEKIAAFFATPLGKRLRESKNVIREFKFSILTDGENIDPALKNERVLLQGVVDCALIDADGITVLDFKSDYVTDETLDAVIFRYRPQILAYADALSRIYQQPIKASYLYFFHLDRFVNVM